MFDGEHSCTQDAVQARALVRERRSPHRIVVTDHDGSAAIAFHAALHTAGKTYHSNRRGLNSPLSLLCHELLPVCIHGVEGEGQAPVGASENHVADHLHPTATHFDQRLFQCRSQTEDL